MYNTKLHCAIFFFFLLSLVSLLCFALLLFGMEVLSESCSNNAKSCSVIMFTISLLVSMILVHLVLLIYSQRCPN